MKHLIILTVLASMCFGNVDGAGCPWSAVEHRIEGTDAVTLTLLNDWILAEKALGLEYYDDTSDYILGVDNNLDQIQAYDPATGSPAGTMPLDPGNDNCFGVAWNNLAYPDDEYAANDWTVSNLFYHDGSSWNTYTNPAGTMGRGMDHYDGYFWQTDRDGASVWRFQLGGSSEELSVPEVPTPLSGLTVYPRSGGGLNVLVNAYYSSVVYVYFYDGGPLVYEGTAAYPVSSFQSSFGLAFDEATGTLFWSWKDASNFYHLAELSIDGVSLQQSTWGTIKYSF